MTRPATGFDRITFDLKASVAYLPPISRKAELIKSSETMNEYKQNNRRTILSTIFRIKIQIFNFNEQCDAKIVINLKILYAILENFKSMINKKYLKKIQPKSATYYKTPFLYKVPQSMLRYVAFFCTAIRKIKTKQFQQHFTLYGGKEGNDFKSITLLLNVDNIEIEVLNKIRFLLINDNYLSNKKKPKNGSVYFLRRLAGFFITRFDALA
ncbi:hypothetical protein BpHYR1_001092 [Brachionus plicatilis]|uniref:Uncharacterized protein n=1 Tax=Brachionus plicatilis TaxID=10195 RepID=A0A3M7RHR3_BRAPC|nr:hypothetical protein BpHYR1_001092 [Brachionus plicatilis]